MRATSAQPEGINATAWASRQNSSADAGHIECLRLLLASGADFEACNEENWTALTCASENGHAVCVGLLLDARASVDQTSTVGDLPCHRACMRGHAECARLLFDAARSRGAESYAATAHPWPVNHDATAEQVAARAVLSKAEAGGSMVEDVNLAEARPAARDAASQGVPHEAGGTAIASLNDKLRAESNLLARVHSTGAAGHAVANMSASAPFISSQQSASIGQARPSMPHCSRWLVDSRGQSGWTPLLCACVNGHGAAVQLLIEVKADLEIKSDKGNSPLYLAARKGHVECTSRLLAANAMVDSTSQSGWTPLGTACENGRVECARLLIAAQADVAHRTEAGGTALTVACAKGQRECAAMLLEAGAAPGACGVNGAPPLFSAAGGGHVSCMELLLTCRVAVDQIHEGSSGWTALLNACCAGHLPAVKVLAAAALYL